MNLTDTERRVLAILIAGNDSYTGYCYLNFTAVAERGKIDRKAVRRACRSLKRKGLAEFGRGLWSEDGRPAGAGYCATRAGAEWLREKAGLAPAGPYKSPQQELFP